MIDSYIIMNRKTSILVKTFLFNILFLVAFVIYGINTCYYQNYLKFHSKILNFNTLYYLEVLVPVKEVFEVTKQNQILIDGKKYNYQVYKIDSDVVYKNYNNYQKVYLEIDSLETMYHKNGYQLDVRIMVDNKKIIEYLKE